MSTYLPTYIDVIKWLVLGDKFCQLQYMTNIWQYTWLYLWSVWQWDMKHCTTKKAWQQTQFQSMSLRWYIVMEISCSCKHFQLVENVCNTLKTNITVCTERKVLPLVAWLCTVIKNVEHICAEDHIMTTVKHWCQSAILRLWNMSDSTLNRNVTVQVGVGWTISIMVHDKFHKK